MPFKGVAALVLANVTALPLVQALLAHQPVSVTLDAVETVVVGVAAALVQKYLPKE